MANTAYLASTLIMGLVVVGVVLLMLRVRRWESYRPAAAYDTLRAGEGGPESRLSRLAGDTGVWTLSFLLLAFGLTAGGTVYVSGVGSALAGPALFAAFGVMLTVYLLGGVYLAMRARQRSSAVSFGASAITLGLLFLVAVSIQLLVA